MTLQIIDCDQNSPEWFSARLGIPTASKFATVMAKGEGKTRSEYMRKLAGEILTEEPSESFSSAHTERGHEMEDIARRHYAFITGNSPERVGFIRNGNKGGSPDSLIGENGGLEIKTALPHIQIDRLESDRLPPEHKAQVQGNLWISEREWWDFVSYWPKLPLLAIRVYRDEDYIKTMAEEIDRFNDELAQLVERVRFYGMREVA
ncbi:lambda exonuclease family protein [Agrobacterium vitis]|uniref:lambda exonuclease family protein n=1 Tax=Agrobacterium vitis TaxID=373 RepID=UPI0015743AA1|nr:lambda exonuclease family protein [Agrobacterium vitis]NSZ52943.1 YqaJ viral recombinase family protein [Agrobacterium vitis]NTA31702.1 YqaJ viral recombinase family protein [Agrobacterium vitis]